MLFEDFCSLNGAHTSDTFAILDNCVFPDGGIDTEFTLVMYSNRGEGVFEIDGVRYTMSHRSMMVLRDGKHVSCVSRSDNFHSKALVIGGDLTREIRVSSEFLSMFIINDRPVLRVTSSYADAAKIFFEALLRVMMFADNPYKDECLKSILRAFFYSTGYYIFESLGFKGNNLFKIAVDVNDAADGQVARFIKLVESNARTCRSLSFYAGKMDYNPKYLSAMIKRETGYSGQYLIDQYALLEAMAKLRYSHRSIKEISNDMEFPSQSDFGKFFKRMTGTSPLAYRKNRFRRR